MTHPNTQRVIDAAAAAGLTISVTRFPEGTRTAADAAAAVGCDVAAIVKSIVLDSSLGPIVVLTSGANRVDYAKVAAALDAIDVRRADPEAARAATGFPIGGTAPFGHPRKVPMLMDQDLLALAQVWAAAGTPDTVFPVAPQALAAATGARVEHVAQR